MGCALPAPRLAACAGRYWSAPVVAPAHASAGTLRRRGEVYLRFASDGQLLDSLRTPDEAMVLDAAGELLLLSTLDGDGADRVVLMRERRSPR